MLAANVGREEAEEQREEVEAAHTGDLVVEREMRRHVHVLVVGFGRIAVSEIEAPNMLVNLV